MLQEEQSTNRSKTTYLAIAALLVAFLAIGAILIVALGESGEADLGGSTEAAKLMPDDTFLFFAFNPHLDQAKNFAVIDKAWGDNQTLKKGLADLLDSMEKEGLDYKVDIEPWLGDEIAFAMGANFLTAMEGAVGEVFDEIEQSLSGDSDQSSLQKVAESPQFIIAVATKDKAASDEFLDKLRAEQEQSSDPLQETEYNGIKIVYQDPEYEGDLGMAFATVDDFILLASGGLEQMQVIVDGRDGDNLAENQSFKDTLAKLPADQVGYGYISLDAYMDTLLDAAGPELEDLPSDLFNPDIYKAFKGVGFSVGFEENGMRVDVVTVYDREGFPEDYPWPQAIDVKTAKHTPANALFYGAGSGLGGALQMVLDMVMAMPDQSDDMEEQLGMLTALLGVTMDELVEMLSGEFALVITHDPNGFAGDPSIPIGASFMIEAKNKEKFESFVRSINGLLGMSGEVDLSEQTINGIDVTSVQDPYSGNLIVGWGVSDDFFALGTNQELLEAAFGSGAVLTDDVTYKAAMAPLPKEKSSVLYMNLEKLIDVIVQDMSPWDRESFDKEGRDLLEPVKAISVGAESYDKDKDSASSTIFILIESE